MTTIEKAIRYIQLYKTWYDEEEEIANEKMAMMRCSLDMVAPNIYDGIHDLLEEFGEDNDLGEGWWQEYGEIEDIYFKL